MDDQQSFIDGVAEEIKVKRTKKTILNVIGCCYDDEKISGLFRLNTFSNQIEFAKAPPWDKDLEEGRQITDEDLVYFKYYLAKNFKFEPPVSLIMEGIITLAKTNHYHPVRQYLNALVWDKQKRLDSWLECAAGVPQDAYTTAVARKILVAAVRRVMFPGCEFHSMMILEGGQGIGKSTLVKILAGPFYANLSFGNIDKDTIDAMLGRWIIEVDELVGFNRQDVEKMKSFITNPADRARLSYQRMTKTFPRQSIFIGTTNPIGDNTYFRDESGNRRFWPVKCGTINLAWMRENRDQLFAEALDALKEGETIFLDSKDALEIARMAQEERLAIDPWTEVLYTFMEQKKTLFVEYVSIIDLAKALDIDISRLTRSEQTRIGGIMRKLGYEGRRRIRDGLRLTVYELNPGDLDGEIGGGQPTGQPTDQPANLIS